eukprot:GSMAST32.ASY1.ANO1.1593.1 assembled CDS
MIGLPRCCYKRRIGRAYICWESKRRKDKSNIKCMIGACWPMMFFTIALIIGIASFVYFTALPNLSWPFWVASFLVTGLTVGALSCTSCSDPGIFPRYTSPEGDHWRYCERSDSYRPPGFLVKDIDHFCPWTGTTIAKDNLIYFQCFVSMLCFHIVFLVFISLMAVEPHVC